MHGPVRVKKEAISSGQYLISSNENGFFQTRARAYDEEAADLLKDALETRLNKPTLDPACRLPIVALDLPAMKGVSLGAKVPTVQPKAKKKAKRRAKA